MELIFYDKAAQIIGCTEGSLRHAVSRGELTRAARKGRSLCLIKEQVELFKGRRVSYKALSPEGKALWHKYADQVNSIESQSQVSNAAINRAEIAQVAQDAARETYTQQLAQLFEAIKHLIEGGSLEGDFFRQHPIIGAITYSLLVAASITAAFLLYQGLNTQEKQEVMSYLGVLDATLKLQEQMPEPPISIEEIRKRRERIALFKQQAKAA